MSNNMITPLIVLFALYASVFGGEDEVGIIGGTDAKIGEFPHQISLRLLNRPICGGSIIGDKWILTAQHCVLNITLLNFTKFVTVVAGTNSLKSGGDVYHVSKIINHEGFNYAKLDHDISLVRLSQNIKMSKLVQRIKLPTEDSLENETVVLTGWGCISTHPIEKQPDKLQKIQLKTITNSKCASIYKNLKPHYDIYPENVCALALNTAGKGVCYGDFGDPLVASGVQVGIASWGIPCVVGVPDVYTRVYKYVDWIKKHIEN